GLQFTLSSLNNTVIGDSSYANATNGLFNSASTGNLCVSCNIGYSSSGVLSPDTGSEISFNSASASRLTLENCLLNPSSTFDATGFAKPNSYVLNYTATPGILQLYGDYQLSGSTLTLDYAQQLYASTATASIVTWGPEAASGFVVNWTTDAYVVSQLITA